MSRVTQPAVRLRLALAKRALQREVFSTLPSPDELERIALAPLDADGPAVGSRPQVTLEDASGRKYLFKLAPPEEIAAELFAYTIRRSFGRLHVPTARRELDLPAFGRVTGMIQPLIPVRGGLDVDPKAWTHLQREAMLREHPWEWMFANLDSHIDQYVLVGPHNLPLNIDWDHSLVDLAQTRLTRFNRRSVTVAPTRNLLYGEYALGRLSLDFLGVRVEARKVARIPDASLTDALESYSRALGHSLEQREQLRARVLRRRDSLVSDFDQLVESLIEARELNLAGVPKGRWGVGRMATQAQDAWQRFVISILHTRVIRPALRQYRGVLGAVSRTGRARAT